MNLRKELIVLLKKIVILFFICIALRIFVFEVYQVSSGSMENALFKGDYVYVDKMYFGSRLPKKLCEIPWINVLCYFSSSEKNPQSDHVDSNYRLVGYSKVHRNDILVFNQPFNQSDFFIKRCIAIPTDTLEINDTSIYINHKRAKDVETSKYLFNICPRPGKKIADISMNLHINFIDNWVTRKQVCQDAVITEFEKTQLNNSPDISSVSRKNSNLLEEDLIAEHPQSVAQTSLVIPFKGMTINLNNENFRLYKYIINNYENRKINFINGKYIGEDGTEVATFRFSKNYYFLMGDNRDFSTDSRSWSLMPEFCIVGKAQFIISSGNGWKRIFSKL